MSQSKSCVSDARRKDRCGAVASLDSTFRLPNLGISNTSHKRNFLSRIGYVHRRGHFPGSDGCQCRIDRRRYGAILLVNHPSGSNVRIYCKSDDLVGVWANSVSQSMSSSPWAARWKWGRRPFMRRATHGRYEWVCRDDGNTCSDGIFTSGGPSRASASHQSQCGMCYASGRSGRVTGRTSRGHGQSQCHRVWALRRGYGSRQCSVIRSP